MCWECRIRVGTRWAECRISWGSWAWMGVVGKITLKKMENQKFELSKGAAAGQGG